MSTERATTSTGHVPYADDLRGDWMLYLNGEIDENQMQATVDYVAQHVAGLRSLLAEAIGDIEDWGAYAGDYFQEKWDLAGDLAKYRAALAVDDAEPDIGSDEPHRHTSWDDYKAGRNIGRSLPDSGRTVTPPKSDQNGSTSGADR